MGGDKNKSQDGAEKTYRESYQPERDELDDSDPPNETGVPSDEGEDSSPDE